LLKDSFYAIVFLAIGKTKMSENHSMPDPDHAATRLDLLEGRHTDEEPAVYQISDRLALTPDHAMSMEVEDGVYEVYYDIDIDGRHRAGDLDLLYSYPNREATIGISIFSRGDLRQGFGKALYQAVPSLPLPRGEDFREAGFRFISRHRSDAARRVWESLVRDGQAIRRDDDSYELIS
jgi:hypothetical protein